MLISIFIFHFFIFIFFWKLKFTRQRLKRVSLRDVLRLQTSCRVTFETIHSSKKRTDEREEWNLSSRYFFLFSSSLTFRKEKGNLYFLRASSSSPTFYFYISPAMRSNILYITAEISPISSFCDIFHGRYAPETRAGEHRKIISGWTLNFPRPGRSIIPAAVVTWRRALEIGNNRGQRNGIIYGNNRKYPAPARGCSIVVPAGRKWLVRAERISRQLLFHGCLQARVFLFVVPFSTRENRPIVSHYTRCLPRPCSFVVCRPISIFRDNVITCMRSE